MMKKFTNKKALKNYASFAVLFICIAFFRTAIADWNYVPSGSMEPNLYDGDWVLVDKTAYGPTIPIANIRLFTTGDPVRGDVIKFVPPHTESLYVKRVIGVPGDSIRFSGRDILINGEKIPYEQLQDDRLTEIGREYLGLSSHKIQYSSGGRLPILNADVVVPENRYFVLGDHRTDSADSRFWGFVDKSKVMGKVTHIALSISDQRDLFKRFAIPLE